MATESINMDVIQTVATGNQVVGSTTVERLSSVVIQTIAKLLSLVMSQIVASTTSHTVTVSINYMKKSKKFSGLN